MEVLNVLIAIGLIHCSLFFFDTIFKVQFTNVIRMNIISIFIYNFRIIIQKILFCKDKILVTIIPDNL